jgi:hypothetical protein
MPEELRFVGAPVVLLLVFGGGFRAVMDGTLVQKDSEILHYLDTYHRRASRPVYSFGRAFYWVV